MSASSSLRHAIPRVVARRRAAALYDPFAQLRHGFFFGDRDDGTLFGRDAFFNLARRPAGLAEAASDFAGFRNDEFFKSIDERVRAAVQAGDGTAANAGNEDADGDVDMNGDAGAGSFKCYSYSSVTRTDGGGKSVSHSHKTYRDSGGRSFQQSTQRLPDGRTLLTDSHNNDATLADDDNNASGDVTTFQEEWEAAWSGVRAAGPQLADSAPEEDHQQPAAAAPAQPPAAAVGAESNPAAAISNHAATRISHLSELHAKGFLTDAEFLAAKQAGQN